MIDCASCGLTISRSFRSSGLPVRQMTRVLPVSGSFAADLVLHLHLVLVGEDHDPRAVRWFSLAMHQLGDDGEDRRATSRGSACGRAR